MNLNSYMKKDHLMHLIYTYMVLFLKKEIKKIKQRRFLFML